jgi:hypothetical protein
VGQDISKLRSRDKHLVSIAACLNKQRSTKKVAAQHTMDFKGPDAATAATPKPVGPSFPSLKREREIAAKVVDSSQQVTVASTPPASDDDDSGGGDHALQNGRAEARREEAELPSPKRARSALSVPSEGALKPESPVMVTDPTKAPGIPVGGYSEEVSVAHVRQASSHSSVSSDLSSTSAATNRFNDAASPVPALFPPAPPSTPASFASVFSFDGAATPLPMQSSVRNAAQLEQQQLLAEGAATPAPTKPAASNGTSSKGGALPEDFSDWAVGDRYELIRILGRGSYGEVAQAVDREAGRPDAYVAIKRIQSPFEQQVDAVRLYREVHILRRMRGHECIIQLLDVVQPPSDDLDDFNDLYLVFECKFLACWLLLYFLYAHFSDSCYLFLPLQMLTRISTS